MRTAQSQCAAQIVEVAPQVVRHLRTHIRAQRNPHFTIPQFRVLVYLHLHGEATLSELAASQGVSLPTMSKLVAALVGRRLVTRKGNADDRRKLTLALTAQGVAQHDAALENTRAYVAAKLATLDDSELNVLARSMRLLQSLFESPAPSQTRRAR